MLCCVLECTASQRRVYSISTTRKFTIKCGNATSLAEGWEAGEQNKQGEGGLARTQPAASAAQESSGTTAARRTGGCLQVLGSRLSPAPPSQGARDVFVEGRGIDGGSKGSSGHRGRESWGACAGWEGLGGGVMY